MSDAAQARIASIVLGLAADDAKEQQDATRELLELTDDLERVPTIVAHSNLSVALVLMKQAKDYYKYIGAEVFMRVFNRNKAVSDILAQHTFISSTMKHLLVNYDVLSATRIEAMRTALARLDAMVQPPPVASTDSGEHDLSSDGSDHHAPALRSSTGVSASVSPTKQLSTAAVDAASSPEEFGTAKAKPHAVGDRQRIPIVVEPPTSGGGGYNPTALLAMLSDPALVSAPIVAPSSDNNSKSHKAAKKSKKSRKENVSAISADALNALNAGVDDDSSDDDSDALPPPAEPDSGSLKLDDAAVAAILTAREHNQWGTREMSTASSTELASAKALMGTIAPAPTIAVADLDELRRQVQIMATSAVADVDDDDDDDDERKLRAVPKKSLAVGHIAPAPTVAAGQLEEFRAQANAIAAGGDVIELDPSMVDKILKDRKLGAFGGQPDAGSRIAPRSGVVAPRSTAAPKDLADYKDAAMQLAERLALIASDTHDDSSDHSAASASLDAPTVPIVLHTPTKNDPKRLRALAFTPSQPPSTGISTQLADFKAQAEALAAQLREAVNDGAEDALTSGDSAEDDPGDPASEPDTPPKNGSLRDPAEKQRPSAKKRAALAYTPKAPAPTGAAPELVDFRSQAMQLAEQLRTLADDGGESDSSIISPPGSGTPTMRDGVRAPAPTMREKQLASYAAQAELLVAKLAEVERVRKSDTTAPRRHRSKSQVSSAAAVSSSSTSSTAASSTATPAVVPNAGVVERLRTAALTRKNSKGDIDSPSGSSSPTTHSPRNNNASNDNSTAAEKPNDKPQRRSTKSKTNQTTTAAQAVASLVAHGGSSGDLNKDAKEARESKESKEAKEAKAEKADKDKEGTKVAANMPRRASVARPVDRPAGRAPLPPRSDKELLTTMEQETELAAQRAELKKRIDAIEQSWSHKPKDEKVLHELMQLGLSLADVEGQLADLQEK